PYPYHLDYYRRQYGGGYEPYFGNLYGSPRIVGTQPFAFSPYPTQAGPTQANPTQANPTPPNAPPAGPWSATPHIQCPHCQQPVQLHWQGPTNTPPGHYVPPGP
ncbi:MAG: hypothetical protein AAF596_07015, partial [Planctomycetota bacterium]